MDIFDMRYLPKHVKKNVNKYGVNLERKDCLMSKVLDLFKHKKYLSIDEIIVGLYRKHKISKSRKIVQVTINKYKNLMARNESGIYFKIKKI